MNVLILYDRYSTHTNTVFDHLTAFAKHSKNSFAYCHASWCIPKIDWLAFDALIIHYSLRIAQGAIRPELMQQIKEFSGLKIIFVQDEYDSTETTRRSIESLGISVVYSCVPARSREEIYPSARFPEVRFEETLTGYVSERTSAKDYPKAAERPIVVGYRGRALPFWYGDLGQEKQIIAERVREYCAIHAIPCDIEWDDSHRIYGDDWVRFLSSCKCTLGTESGSNLFDIDGELRKKFSTYLHRHPKATYVEARANVLGNAIDEEPIMNQVSPRIFESIACGTALVLFEGNYSGVVQPNRHFIPLKKDFSNIDEVFQTINDDEALQSMVDCAYEEVIQTDRYTYATFIAQFDAVLEEESVGRARNLARPIVYNALVHAQPNQITYFQPHRVAGVMWHSIPFGLRAKIKPLVHKAISIIKK